MFNTWISGEVLETVAEAAGWRWGEWSDGYRTTVSSNVPHRNWHVEFHIPVGTTSLRLKLCTNFKSSMCAFPLISTLWWINYKTKRAGGWDDCPTPFRKHGGWKLAKALFWQLDVVGMVFVICIFGFILVPFTIAGGTASSWTQAKIIAPMAVGILMIPAWILWERATPHPMVPFFVCPACEPYHTKTNAFQLLKDRAIWGPLGIAFMLMFCKFILILMTLN